MIDISFFWKWDSMASVCSFSRCLLFKLLKYWAAKLRNLWKDMIAISTFRVWDSVTGMFLNLTFSNKFLLDSCCSISKSQISNHGFKWLSGSVILTDKSECVSKFRLAFVFLKSLVSRDIRGLHLSYTSWLIFGG